MTARAAAEASKLIDEILFSTGKTRADLARETGLTRQKISDTLNNTPLIDRRARHWPAILDALGLEVVVQVKRTP